jgi:2-polyprenyl-3-methyl-5-hydroxy-6-metoxy-1,4-benzoquinol methylase
LGNLLDWSLSKIDVIDLDLVRHVWRFLSPLPVFWRVHQVGRSLLIPFRSLVPYLPPHATGHVQVLLDLGCGHGVFLSLVKRERPDLELVGLDLSTEKIEGARRAFKASGWPVRDLMVLDIADFDDQSVDAITIIDVLYLVPVERWSDILQKCHECLRPGGKLLLKEMNRAIRWKFALMYLEETLAVKVLGFTLGSNFTFPTSAEVRLIMKQAGFSVEEVPLDRGYFTPHMLWIGTKRLTRPSV